MPSLDLLFSGYAGSYIAKCLKVNERIDLVAACEALDKTILVLTDPLSNIIGEANVQSSRLIGHHVNIVGFTSGHSGIIDVAASRIQRSLPCVSQIPPLRDASHPSGRNDNGRGDYEQSRPPRHFERSSPLFVISSEAKRSREIRLTCNINRIRQRTANTISE